MRDGAQSRRMKHCTASICCVVIYIYSDMTSGFQPWWRAKDADGAAGGQLNTTMGRWRSPSEVDLPA